MNNRRLRVALGVGMSAIIVIAAALLVIRARSAPTEITIATGFPQGTYFPLGTNVARVISDHERLDARAIATRGSVNNIDLLLDDDEEVDLAFVLRPALVKRSPADRAKLRALCRLYAGVMHVLVRNEGVTDLHHLDGKRIYIGELKSGNRVVVEQILEAARIGYVDYHETDEYLSDLKSDPKLRVGFGTATRLLEEGVIDAAFIAAGRPTLGVEEALTRSEGRLRLLSLRTDDEIPETHAGPRNDETVLDLLTDPKGTYEAHRLRPETIPARFYRNQPESVRTLQWDSYIICRDDVADRDARAILQMIFANIRQLLEAHTKAADIKLARAFSEWTDTHEEVFDFEVQAKGGLLELHGGAVEFLAEKRDTLFIATGHLATKYYDRGLVIQTALERAGYKARVLHTDGSLENAELLDRATRHDHEYQVLAIMQLDTALAALQGRSSNRVYGSFGAGELVPSVPSLRRLATFDDEMLHIIYRRGPNDPVDLDAAKAIRRLIDQDQASSICIGPRGSGTQLVMQALLAKAGIESDGLVHASIADMTTRLGEPNELRVGCMMSYAPSPLITALLDDPDIELLSIEAKLRQRLVSELVAFTPTTIDGAIYGAEDEPPIKTIGTTSILVANEHVADVRGVTKAIYGAAPFFAGGLTAQGMAQDTSLVLHPEAERALQDLDLVGKPPPLLTIAELSAILGGLVVLLGALRGGYALRRDRIANEIGRRILGVRVGANEADSVDRLRAIHDEISECIRTRWWRRREIDRGRARNLRQLIDERIILARRNVLRSIVTQIRTVAERSDLDDDTRHRSFRLVEQRIWDAFSRARLSIEQKRMLRELMAEAREHAGDTAPSVTR
ncbi:MAG: TAXI family TRAP transporter solute-binding subunit [Planctomycetota bacterium]|jgi:TRAP transporter TAXI family solute receptor